MISTLIKKYKFNISVVFVLVLPMLLICACETISEDLPVFPVKNKTVFVYLIANNNLSGDAIKNIAEIESGFVPNDDVDNLVVYSHTVNANPKLLRIYKDKEGKVVRDTVYNFPKTNSATAAALKSAISVVTTMYPAQENGLILWSHGTGWLPRGYYATGGFPTNANFYKNEKMRTEFPWRGYPGGIDPYANMVKSFGADGNNEIEIFDLVKGLPHKFNYVIFDACLMGGIEVAYELKDSTDYVMFSPTEVITSGYCYSQMMSYLFQTPVNLTGMAQNVYNYYNSKPQGYQYATISLVKTSELKAVADAAKVVFNKYRANISTLNMEGIQKYFRADRHWFYDINDFIGQLAGHNGAVDAAAFKAALNNAVIYKATTPMFLDISIDETKYSGISTYIPNPKDEKLMEFYKKYQWEVTVGMTSK
ncbi:MAG: clostripain-related cysteine peptidase [Bacteroidales bacterium]